MGYRPEIDKLSCQSSGRCVDAAPEGFRFDDDQLAEPQPGAESLPKQRLVEIARNCPALAISLYDEQGREVDF